MDAVKALVVNETVDFVAGGKLALNALFVFEGASFEIACHTGVESFRAVGHYVDEVGVGMHGSFVGSPALGAGLPCLRMTAVQVNVCDG